MDQTKPVEPGVLTNVGNHVPNADLERPHPVRPRGFRQILSRSKLKYGKDFAKYLIVGILYTFINIFLMWLFIDVLRTGTVLGSILAVSEEDLILAVGALAVTVSLMAYFYKEFQVYCFDEEWARVCGVNVDRLQDILLTLIAAAVVVSIKLLGALLVSALLVIPGAVAYQLAGNYRVQFPIAITCSLVSVILGLTLSYRFDIASGAAIALSASGLFLVSTLFAPKWE